MDCHDELNHFAEHFKDVDSAIREYFKQMLDGDFSNKPDLVGSRIEDINSLLTLRLLENDRSASLTILAALESWFRIDCRTRAEKRERSPVGRRFKKMYNRCGQSVSKIRFEDILDTWSDAEPTSKQIIRQVKDAFNYRHWLAHGRYWVPKLGRKYDYSTVYVIANDAAILLNK